MTVLFKVFRAAGIAIISIKLVVFAVDDSAFVEIEDFEPLEKGIGVLIDESIRFRSEREEEHEAVGQMAAALSRMAIRAILSAKSVLRGLAQKVKGGASAAFATWKMAGTAGVHGCGRENLPPYTRLQISVRNWVGLDMLTQPMPN